ncbi:MAG: hypothetical protein IEMM0008_1045 [bacterium]|nr:MAG: hypothetical protein IEMM0008_1045 [bacterium]
MNNTPSKTELIELLPHKYPVLMVDTVIKITTEVSVTQNKVKSYNPFICNHQLAESAFIELMAQTTATTILFCHYKDNPSLLRDFRESGKAKMLPGYLVTIKDLNVYSSLAVEDEFQVTSTKIYELEDYYSFDCLIHKGDKLIAEGVISIYATS